VKEKLEKKKGRRRKNRKRKERETNNKVAPTGQQFAIDGGDRRFVARRVQQLTVVC
jgi:hypothetical protein